MPPTAAIVNPEPVMRQVMPLKYARQIRLLAMTDRLAADAYRVEQELMGVDLIEPWSALPAVQQAHYLKRVQAFVAGGIGYLHGKAHDQAIREIVTDHEVWANYNEQSAHDIEQMLGKVVLHYETILVRLFAERAK